MHTLLESHTLPADTPLNILVSKMVDVLLEQTDKDKYDRHFEDFLPAEKYANNSAVIKFFEEIVRTTADNEKQLNVTLMTVFFKC